MRLAVEKKDLNQHIQHLSSIVPSKATNPILTNYLIEASAERNTVQITTTDLDITAIVRFSAAVSEGGTVAVSAKHLNEIVANMPDDMINIWKSEDLLVIQCGKIDFKLLCADHTLYPIIPPTALDKAQKIDAELFQRMISKTSFAVSTDSNRPVLTGICWKIFDNEQLMAATDGRKVAEIKIRGKLEQAEAEEARVAENIFSDAQESVSERVIPVKALNFMQRIYRSDVKELHILMEHNKLMLAYGDYIVFSQILEHKYPEYQKAFVHDLPNCLIIDRERLKLAIKRVSLVSPDDNLRTRFEIDNDRFEINTSNRDTGDAKQFMDEYTYQGSPTHISFNYRFMMSILEAIDTEKVKILLGSSKEPMMIYNETNPENQELTFLLMPLRS